MVRVPKNRNTVTRANSVDRISARFASDDDDDDDGATLVSVLSEIWLLYLMAVEFLMGLSRHQQLNSSRLNWAAWTEKIL